MHLFRIHSRPNAGDEPASHGFAARLPAHSVMVVDAVEQDWPASAQRWVPELPVLVHAGKRDAFPNGTAAERSIAVVSNHDARPTVDPLEERRAGSDGAGTAHDGVVRVDPKRSEEGVHGAAQPAVQPGLAGEDLAVSSVEEEAECEILDRALVPRFHWTQDRSVAIGPH